MSKQWYLCGQAGRLAGRGQQQVRQAEEQAELNIAGLIGVQPEATGSCSSRTRALACDAHAVAEVHLCHFCAAVRTLAQVAHAHSQHGDHMRIWVLAAPT